VQRVADALHALDHHESADFVKLGWFRHRPRRQSDAL
jgi:hypothetical protein